ncbi:MAG: DUF6600 domain-containing protein [Betaproteobacteria bacterium]
MKVLKAMIIATILLIAPAYAFPANFGYMRISLIDGDVQIKTPDAGDWGPASINVPLLEGDQIWVPQEGRVELQLNTGSYIRLDQNSALQILSLDRDSSQFYLSQGHAYLFYDAPRGGVIQIDTPDASTRAFDRAIFRIDMSDEYQYTDVAVYKGYVETENRVGRTRINAGEMLTVGQNTNGEVAPIGPPDEWETWNKSRNDRMLARRDASSRYLPPELRAYSYDFDAGGRWVEVPDYGYCWTPTVIIGAGWAPYRFGRWAWIGGDYVWVSYDPWGWAPYHYGRWAFVASIGWFWVPPVAGAVYWGPGYVGWVTTGDYVGWVPLAPGEIYYGRGYYGPHSVNITTINVNQVNITNVYKNVYINNGVTVVNRNTFATASPKIVSVNQRIIQQQIFTKNNISVGTPAIKPTKASYFASSRPVPPAKLPPQPVRNLQIKELKQSRPFMKDPGRSVLNPGARPKQLPVNPVATPRTPGKGKPMVQPAERGRRGAPGGPPPSEERPQVRPSEKRPAGPEGGPAPREERPQVRPSEKRPAGPEGGPAPREERPQVRPSEKRPAGPEGGPAPRGERPQVKPSEKRPAGPEGGPAQKKEKKSAEPDDGSQKDQKKQRTEEPER